MKYKCGILIQLIFIITGNAQTTIPRDSLISDDSIYVEILDDTDFVIGWSVLNIGYIGNSGPSSEYLTGDLTIRPGILFSYKRIYSFVGMNFGDFKVKKDFESTPLEKDMETYHQLIDVSLGYDISSGNFKIVPNIGYSWLYLRLENEGENLAEYYEKSFSYNITFISVNNPMNRNRIFKGNITTDMFATSYLTFGMMPFNYSNIFKGSYYYFSVGVYFNHKFT